MPLLGRRRPPLATAARSRVLGLGSRLGRAASGAGDAARGTRVRAPEWLHRLAGFERRRVPPHVFAVESGRLLYGRFTGEAPPLTLSELHEQTLPAGLWPDGPLGGPARDPGALAAAVTALAGAGHRRAQRGGPVRPAEASLVVPDAWLRLAFTELNELPVAGEERDAVLRWKLKGLTPFRVDELRVEAAEVAAPVTQEGARRVLIGFGLERLLAQLEEVFRSAGVRVGQLVSSGVALASLATVLGRDGGLTALAYVRPEGYGLAFQHGDALLFHRVKLRGGDTDTAAQVHRDLMLTRSYLDENFPDLELGALLLLAPESEQPRWMSMLGDGFDRAPRALGPDDLPLGSSLPLTHWLDVAPLLGASFGEY